MTTHEDLLRLHRRIKQLARSRRLLRRQLDIMAWDKAVVLQQDVTKQEARA